MAAGLRRRLDHLRRRLQPPHTNTRPGRRTGTTARGWLRDTRTVPITESTRSGPQEPRPPPELHPGRLRCRSWPVSRSRAGTHPPGRTPARRTSTGNTQRDDKRVREPPGGSPVIGLTALAVLERGVLCAVSQAGVRRADAHLFRSSKFSLQAWADLRMSPAASAELADPSWAHGVVWGGLDGGSAGARGQVLVRRTVADWPSCWPLESCAVTAKYGPSLLMGIMVEAGRGCDPATVRAVEFWPAKTVQLATSVSRFQPT